jgi:hypothetical protein
LNLISNKLFFNPIFLKEGVFAKISSLNIID